ncbi:dicarboxylate/amino acid:cation symporter [Aliidiomarina taiwanensis]|uniref:Dicarboxylate/amino acid:cation symporter n=1 Tax=Aliidiomarina taiwanensis TaxID=946228 RepID=A0A432X8U9_9GAMM|nr:dicarboxylate/amino acid:cation symporter [Aliidiomarina taiwanensis]RUO43855.1 dicarboxylate/amino acid:cation symporter [Aliidiomarina taiwanensis]
MLAIWFKIPFWQRVLGAFVFGSALGLLAPSMGVAVQPLGQLFIHSIQMLVAPLVFITIVCAMFSLGAEKGFGKIAGKTILLFVFTAFVAGLIGLSVAYFINLTPSSELVAADNTIRTVPPVSQVLLDIIPRNPFAALAEGNVLQIIVFAVLVGLALNHLGEHVAPLKRGFEAAREVMFQLTRWVLELTPLGVFGLMAWVVGSFGLDMLLPLGKFIIAIYIACLLQMALTYGGLMHFFGGMKVSRFFRTVFPTQLIAFTTSSSYGTLPSTLKTTTEGLKVSSRYASFVAPLGATINMDGCGGIYPAIAAVFIAQLYGIPLGMEQYLLIMFTATLASLGTAGIPGSAVIMLTVTLSVVGLPLEGIAFIAAIDRIIDMIRTTTNITGDMVVARVVAYQEGLIEEAPDTENAYELEKPCVQNC